MHNKHVMDILICMSNKTYRLECMFCAKYMYFGIVLNIKLRKECTILIIYVSHVDHKNAINLFIQH